MKTQSFVGSALFRDLHELESNFYRWELVFKKVSIGHFHGALNVIDLGVVQLIDARMSGTLFQYGRTPEGYVTFAIPAIDTHPFRWHYRNVGNSTLLLFPANRELNAVSYDGFHVYTLSIHEQFLVQLIEKFGLDSVGKHFKGQERVVQIGKRFIYSLNSLLQALFLKVQISQKPALSKSAIRNVKYTIPEMVLNIVHQNSDSENISVKRERDRAISKATEFILSQDLTTLTVQDVTAKTGIKQRSLEYAFKEYFNVGPKFFITALRLNNFRHALIKSGDSVSESAFDHGYNHLGQLSRDYKLLFGELPSETLKWAKSLPHE